MISGGDRLQALLDSHSKPFPSLVSLFPFFFFFFLIFSFFPPFTKKLNLTPSWCFSSWVSNPFCGGISGKSSLVIFGTHTVSVCMCGVGVGNLVEKVEFIVVSGTQRRNFLSCCLKFQWQKQSGCEGSYSWQMVTLMATDGGALLSVVWLAVSSVNHFDSNIYSFIWNGMY